MKVTIQLSSLSEQILKEQLVDFSEMCERTIKLTPALINKIVNGLIECESDNYNLFETYINEDVNIFTQLNTIFEQKVNEESPVK